VITAGSERLTVRKQVKQVRGERESGLHTLDGQTGRAAGRAEPYSTAKFPCQSRRMDRENTELFLGGRSQVAKRDSWFNSIVAALSAINEELKRSNKHVGKSFTESHARVIDLETTNGSLREEIIPLEGHSTQVDNAKLSLLAELKESTSTEEKMCNEMTELNCKIEEMQLRHEQDLKRFDESDTHIIELETTDYWPEYTDLPNDDR
jgi:hypothetical protein